MQVLPRDSGVGIHLDGGIELVRTEASAQVIRQRPTEVQRIEPDTAVPLRALPSHQVLVLPVPEEVGQVATATGRATGRIAEVACVLQLLNGLFQTDPANAILG